MNNFYKGRFYRKNIFNNGSRDGFLLIQLGVIIMILTIAAALAGGIIIQRINDSKAHATGKYLASVRNGLIKFQISNYERLRETGGDAAFDWTPVDSQSLNGDILLGSVQDLIDNGDLNDGFPLYPPLGERALWLMHRVCALDSEPDPDLNTGTQCDINAFVYTCHPISDARSTNNINTSCSIVSDGRKSADINLVGEVIIATEGMGGTDVLNSGAADSNYFSGPILGTSAHRELFPAISNDKGRVVLSAGLQSSPFDQFVRVGDERVLNFKELSVDSLKVSDSVLFEGGFTSRGDAYIEGVAIALDGLVTNEDHSIGGECTIGAVSIQRDKSASLVCEDDGTGNGKWRAIPDNSIKYAGEIGSEESFDCLPGFEPWRSVAVSEVNVRVDEILIEGDLNGTINAGNVPISIFNNSFNFPELQIGGSFSNDPTKTYIDIRQGYTQSGESTGNVGGSAVIMGGCKPIQ